MQPVISSAFDNDHWGDALAGIGLGEDALAPAPDLGLFFASPLYPDLLTLIESVWISPYADRQFKNDVESVLKQNRLSEIPVHLSQGNKGVGSRFR